MPGVRYEIREERNLLIPMRDGTLVAANAYFPVTDEPVPALVSGYPYHKDGLIGAMFDHARRWFAERGFAELIFDFRGTGASDGICPDTFDAVQEGQDGADVVEWAAAQSWCSGNVGIWGMSYGGITALNVAAQAPPHLRASVPLYGSADIHADFIAPGGIPNALGNMTRETFMLAMDLAPPIVQDRDGRWLRVWQDHLDRLERGDLWALRWPQRPSRDDEHWHRRAPDLSRVEAATFMIGGWSDIFPDAMVRAYEAIQAPKRIVMGPWVHVLPDMSPLEPWDWLADVERWFDRWLRDEPNGADDDPAVTYFVRGIDRWAQADAWPGAEHASRWHLSADGLGASEPLAGPESTRYEPDPTVGTQGMLLDPMGAGIGYPLEQAADDARSATFDGPAVDTAVDVIGQPVVNLHVVADGDGPFDLVVKLCAVDRHGRSTLVTTGWAAVERSGEVRVPLWATACRVPAGSRLRVSVSCADFPHSFPATRMEPIEIRHSSAQRSWIEVPQVPALTEAEAHEPRRPDPDVNRAPLVVRAQPAWRVIEDRVQRSSTVEFGERLEFNLPAGVELTLDLAGEAFVRRDRPDLARVVAHAELRLTLNGGEQVSIAAASRTSRTTMAYEATVEIDGVRRFAGDWRTREAE
jgi:putative CocE/NonD family hydrolase